QVSLLLLTFFLTNLLDMVTTLFVLANSGKYNSTFSNLIYLLITPLYIGHILSVDRRIQSCLEAIAIALKSRSRQRCLSKLLSYRHRRGSRLRIAAPRHLEIFEI